MRSLLLAVVVALLAVPSLASAQMPAPPTSVEGNAAPPGARTHDGFYLRLATGFGSHFESINMEDHDPGLTVTGLSSVGEFAVGWTVTPGLVLGLGSYSATVIASDRSYDSDQPAPPAEIMDDVQDFNLFGPFVDLYFNARRGMHFQGAIGVATVRGVGINDARWEEDEIVVGAGAMLGFGYDWWISDEWSVGILARIVGAAAVSEDDTGVRWEHGVGASPSLLFTATYN